MFDTFDTVCLYFSKWAPGNSKWSAVTYGDGSEILAITEDIF